MCILKPSLMKAFYTSLVLVSAGVSFAISSVYLALALNKRNKSYLLFGLMILVIVMFFLLPPTGFILYDVPAYPGHVLFLRLFIFTCYAITPGFILAYSGYPKRILVSRTARMQSTASPKVIHNSITTISPNNN